MILKGEKEAREVVKYFRSLPQCQETVKLLGIKVQLQEAYEASRYIEMNYPQYTAHKKEDDNQMSISHQNLKPTKCTSVCEDVARDAITLWEASLKKKEITFSDVIPDKLELVSIKILLPVWVDVEVVSSYISSHSKYRVHPKYQGKYPVIAIGN